jgi:hypothetical protein
VALGVIAEKTGRYLIDEEFENQAKQARCLGKQPA